MRSHIKFGPERFSRFDVYWIRKTDRQTDKSIHIDEMDKETCTNTHYTLAGAAYNILSGGGGKRNFLYPPMEFYTGNLCQNQQAGVYNLFLKIQIKGLEGACSLLAPVI